ncbi:MAG: hypothetical protein ABIN48_13035 [Ginsengibacter sp.]
MKKFHQLLSVAVLVAFAAFLSGCDKTKPYDLITPPEQVHFVGDRNQTYALEDATTGTFKLVIGTTDISATDRTVKYVVTSPTGALNGTHYTIAPAGTVTIPAGKSTATIEINGDYSKYVSGRKDTLKFTLSEPSIKVAGFMNEANVILRGPCFDGDVILSQMGGDYANSSDADYPLYTVKLTGLVVTSPTTGKGMIAGLWDGGAPVEILFDWTDPANIKASIAWQHIGFNYAPGNPFAIRTSPGQKSTFSICDQTITLIVDLIVEDYGGPGSHAGYALKYLIKVVR